MARLGATVGDGDADGSGPGGFGPGHAVRRNAKIAADQTANAKLPRRSQFA